MRLLLDTHVAIWWDLGVPLAPRADRAIREAAEVYVSAASGWEIAIKASIGKLRTTRTLAALAADSGFTELPVTLRHAEGVRALPSLHGDPFDRLLVAQAVAEGLTLVTRDPAVLAYPARTMRG